MYVVEALTLLLRLGTFSWIHSFIHTEHLYSASSRELLRGASDSSMAKKSSLESIFNPWLHSPLMSDAFSFTFFPCHCVFQSSFCPGAIRFLLCFFIYDRNICTLSLDPLFLTLGEFQAWDLHWYPLTFGPRSGVEVHMEQKSQCKFRPWPGFEPRTFHLAVQHATARPLHIQKVLSDG